MFITAAGETLLLKRGPGGDWPGAWCFPGGKVEDGETLEQAAVRECEEELGFCPDGPRKVFTRRVSDNQAPIPADAINPVPPIGEPVDYTTFIQYVPGRFDPQLNGEHTAFAWCQPGTPPEPVHPGAAISLARRTMDELGAARAVMAGDLASPHKFENVWLFALRITGTGTAYRDILQEFVYRKPENYLNDEFLARCNGLPVVWKHPETGKLDSDYFDNAIVGTIMLPYIKGDEVWGIARIYNDDAAGLMESEQLSTSPAVVFRKSDGNIKAKMEDGKTLLIEGKPCLLDHLAICKVGVWDKGGAPAGVDLVNTETSGELIMADAEKEAPAEARKDSEGGNLDKLLTAIDALCSKMDAMEKRVDSLAEIRKDDDDDAKRKDEGDKEMGEPVEIAADKRKDAAMPEEAMKADDDDAKRKDDDDYARKDSGVNAAVNARLEAEVKRLAALVSGMPMNTGTDEYAALAEHQARADSVYGAFGERAPAPLQGETAGAYRIRLAKGMQAHSEAWRDVPLRNLPENAMEIAERQIYADAAAAARSPAGVAPGMLREVKKRDAAGRTITEFVGGPSAWMGEFRTAPRSIAKPFFRPRVGA